ncbi:MAG TPA: DUF1735 domain-containing protein, partial [Sphingobacterium sp.]|nr:DUF1735 domain-containing protein [Sphingobacterium sp.]
MRPFTIVFMVAISSTIFGSCQKELISNQDQYSKIYIPQAIEIPAVRDFQMADDIQYFTFGAGYGGVADLTSEISVYFKDDLSLIDQYNEKHQTNYLPMPAGAYTLSGTEAQIETGKTNSNALKVGVKTVGGLEPLKEYLLPISIAEVNKDITVNENLRTAYFLIKGTYFDCDRSDWSIHAVSSEDNVEIGLRVLDGNTSTMWHTAWRNGVPNPPHFIALDMKKEMAMHGIYMWPDHRNTQAPKNIDIHVSKDGQNWTLVGNYTLPNVIQRHTLYFDTTHLAKYFKITIHT